MALLAGLSQQGALVLVIARPGTAGLAAVLVVALVLGPVPGARVSRAGGGGQASFYWELADRLGSGLVMLDQTGARRLHRTYSPFGMQQAAVGSATWLPRHFAGHREDEDSGLLYMQARWMDPASGTFLSIDPVVADAFDPQSYNAYSYTRNNPVSFNDPTGACIQGSACDGRWYGQLPAGMSVPPGAQGVASNISNAGFLKDSGATAGMSLSDFRRGSRPSGFSEFMADIFDSIASVFQSDGGGPQSSKWTDDPDVLTITWHPYSGGRGPMLSTEPGFQQASIWGPLSTCRSEAELSRRDRKKS